MKGIMFKGRWPLSAALGLLAILVPAYASAQDAQSERLQQQMA